ncbi:1-deoxy-D-xylulose-5-phosphate reductoisomerase [Gammaproteobacteria bacterium]|nr:1-deoxy-D-xylulose-5-phosphate reductoisomerase [Gammaproteobacteria bacterium]
MKKNVIILGSTGSIGVNTLEVLSKHKELFEVFALVANSSVGSLLEQCKKFKPKYAYINKEEDAKFLTTSMKKFKIKTEILFGKDTLNKLVSLEEVDTVVCAISGSAGLESSLSAVQSGKKILLANKESLVMCGSLFMDLAEEYNSVILPVDSEHNALHQCFAANTTKSIEKIILTASGGPFLESNISKLKNVTPEQALNHPTWSMGKKISIDSATMMNKGLEIIEAMYLFKLEISQIDTLIHPQSLIHSMVCYKDGSIIMQASKNDMKIPISYCLGWPERISSGIEPIDLTKQSSLNFFEVSKDKFPCFYLAKQAGTEGESFPTAMNAANEIAVQAFLEEKIKFTDIFKIIFEVLEKHHKKKLSSVEDVYEVDKNSRENAIKQIKKIN